jgi:hypothetical protein
MCLWIAGMREENLKLIANQGWFVFNSSNRLVNPDGTGNRPIKEIHIPQRYNCVFKGV